MDRADRENPLEAEPGKFVHVFFREARVHLVDRDQDGLAAGPQLLGDFPVERNDPLLHIDHKDDRAGGLDGDLHLLERGLGDDVVGLLAAQKADAAGVHERVDPPVPFGFHAHAVAGDAGLVMDDGNAALDDAVEER